MKIIKIISLFLFLISFNINSQSSLNESRRKAAESLKLDKSDDCWLDNDVIHGHEHNNNNNIQLVRRRTSMPGSTTSPSASTGSTNEQHLPSNTTPFMDTKPPVNGRRQTAMAL